MREIRTSGSTRTVSRGYYSVAFRPTLLAKGFDLRSSAVRESVFSTPGFDATRQNAEPACMATPLPLS